MALLRLKRQASPTALMTGRAYFASAAKDLGLSGLDAVEVQSLDSPPGLKPGRKESKVGGRIARNLKHLSKEETAERRERSERFLKQPDQVFPAEEETTAEGVPK